MAILRNRATQRKVCLRALHVFGCNRASDTVLEQLDASRLHASVRWTGAQWELRNHSRNGTFLNGALLIGKRGVGLDVGNVLAFGRTGGPDWVVEDVGAPADLLWPVGHDSAPILLGRSNLLPEGVGAELSIHCSSAGQWICTAPQGVRVLEDGDALRIANQDWRFVSVLKPLTPQRAPASGGAPWNQYDATLHFRVSLNEEHVWIEMHYPDRVISLEERSHHYLLLILARLRLADAHRNLDSDTQGWIGLERLATMLCMDPSHLNIHIFRVRKQLSLALGNGSYVPEVIERNRESVRFGNLRFRITRGTQLESHFDPLPTHAFPAGVSGYQALGLLGQGA